MANNSRLLKRDKHKLEPISIDELAGDSTMTGFSDLFKIPIVAAEPSPAADGWNLTKDSVVVRRPSGEESYGPETPPPVSVGLVDRIESRSSISTTSVDSSALEPDPSVSDWATVLEEKGGSETAPPDTHPPGSCQYDNFPAPLRRKLQIREAKLVQEGHTYGEQTVYDALWKNATVVNESIRLITIGFLRMAGIAGLAESNCKVAVSGLMEKLAIERLADRNISQGRTYRVYGWTAVLSRRRAAGLTHVIKSRGVVFVDPKTGRQLTLAKTLPRRQPETTGRQTSGAVSGGRPSATYTSNGASRSESADVDPPLLPQSSRKGLIQDQPSVQTAIVDLASRLRKDLDSAFDDSAAARLWRECRDFVPDCTVDEILYFTVLKGQKINRDRNIRNPIGLLLMSVPEFFTGRAVHELRAQKSREEEQRRELQDQQRKYWSAVAQDSKTPADERELALKFLAEID